MNVVTGWLQDLSWGTWGSYRASNLHLIILCYALMIFVLFEPFLCVHGHTLYHMHKKGVGLDPSKSVFQHFHP